MTDRLRAAWVPLALGVFTAGAGAGPARGQEASLEKLPGWAVARAEQAIHREMFRQRIPGMTVAIAHQGRRWTSGYGYADVENRVLATPRTVYRLASISKPITAVAVMQLAEQGRVDLDAPVQRYVPGFPEKKWPLTSRQLLCHQGGIRWYRGDEMCSTRRFDTLTQALGIFKDDPLAFEPGTQHLYSTYGYNLLGAVIEGASGDPYLDYVRAHIFKPAGMIATRDDDAEAIIPNRASGYRRGGRGELRRSRLMDTSNKIPGGGLCGTAADLVAFGRALDRGELLGSAMVESMMAPVPTRKGEPTTYGLGWQVTRTADKVREVWHNGAQPQVSNILYMRPDHDLAVAILSNLEGADLGKLARALADAVTGTGPRPAATALQVVP